MTPVRENDTHTHIVTSDSPVKTTSRMEGLSAVPMSKPTNDNATPPTQPFQFSHGNEMPTLIIPTKSAKPPRKTIDPTNGF